jgi:hypothetical protein
LILEAFQHPAKPHLTCILPSVRGGVFNYLRRFAARGPCPVGSSVTLVSASSAVK